MNLAPNPLSTFLGLDLRKSHTEISFLYSQQYSQGDNTFKENLNIREKYEYQNYKNLCIETSIFRRY